MIFNQHVENEKKDEIMIKNITDFSVFDSKEGVIISCLERLNS